MSRLLSGAQWIAAFAVIALSTVSSPRVALSTVSAQPNIPVEFRAILLSLPDLPAFLLILLTLARLLLDEPYIAQFRRTIQPIMTRFGGLFWIALAVWSFVTLAWAATSSMALYTSLHLTLAMLTALCVASLITRENDLWRLLAVLVIVGVVQAAAALIQVAIQGPIGLFNLGEVGVFPWDSAGFYRARGLTMHPNYLGGVLMLALFACLTLWVALSKQKRARTLILIAGLFTLAGLTGTFSRSAFVGLIVGCAPLIVLILRQRLRRVWIVAGLAVAIIVLGIGAVAVRGDLQTVQTRLFGAREFFFDYTFRVIQERPLLGIGSGNLMLRVGQIEGNHGQDLLPVHNVYLYVWAELGVPGLVLFMGGLLSLLWRTRLWTATQPWPGRILGGALLAMAVVMLFDNYFWGVHPHRMTFFWMVGLIWGYLALQFNARLPSHARPDTPPTS